MKERIQVKLFLLQALAQCSGAPMPERALIDSAKLAFPHLEMNDEDVMRMVKSCEAGKLIAASVDELTETTLYVLTTRGAAQLAARS